MPTPRVFNSYKRSGLSEATYSALTTIPFCTPDRIRCSPESLLLSNTIVASAWLKLVMFPDPWNPKNPSTWGWWTKCSEDSVSKVKPKTGNKSCNTSTPIPVSVLILQGIVDSDIWCKRVLTKGKVMSWRFIDNFLSRGLIRSKWGANRWCFSVVIRPIILPYANNIAI